MTKILVIEDERLARDSILNTLENEGFQLIEAADGRTGLTSAQEQKPDVIICDVILPELDGYEVLTSVRQEPTTAVIPFIFLTAKADKADVRRGMELGADDYLTKPFTPAELLGAIAARLKRKEAFAQYAQQFSASPSANTNGQVEQQNTSSNNQPAEYHSTDALVNELSALKLAQFTGKLTITSASDREWKFYLHQGRILYATGGVHPIKRWQRHLATYCPQIQVNQLNLPAELFAREAWEYQLFGLWLKQQQMSREQVAQVIRDSVTEVLFDILQAEQVKYQTQPENPLPFQLLLIEVEQVLAPAAKLWQAWKTANLTNLLPNKAPAIQRPELLEQQTSPATYKQLTALLDGKRTLRDLALQMKRQASEVTTSLLPYISSGIVELIDIPDLPVPGKFN
jgi:two-component system, chemotaxis family, response regulator PixG